ARGFVRVDGKPVADRASDSASYYPVLLDQNGASQLGEIVAGAEQGNCGDWTSSNGNDFFTYGDPSSGLGDNWNGGYRALSCIGSFHLYCFQKDHVSPMTFTRASGRTAFITSYTVGTGGLGDADARCRADALASGLGGSYKA